MRKTHTIQTITAILLALAATPAGASYEADDVVAVSRDEGHTGYDTVPSATGHAVTSGCTMIRTNRTLVKWSGHATATGHDGVASTSVTCYLQVSSPSTAYTVGQTASEKGPAASFGNIGIFVPSDANVSTCVYQAQARWTDSHGALYANQNCVSLN